MRITAQSPCRVDLAGATLDIWPLYLHHANAVTVNFAVDRYTSCVLETRDDAKIVLRSQDLKSEETFDSLGDLRKAAKYKLPLLAYLVKFFAPHTGLTLDTNSEAPAGAVECRQRRYIRCLCATTSIRPSRPGIPWTASTANGRR